jgi:drug/metabolite transporter superfamily protein YnfA
MVSLTFPECGMRPRLPTATTRALFLMVYAYILTKYEETKLGKTLGYAQYGIFALGLGLSWLWSCDMG